MTSEELEKAAADARKVVADSKIIQACIATMIASRRAYMVAREVLADDLKHGWELGNKDLIEQTLVMSAQEKANEKFSVVDLSRDILRTVVPVLDIVARQLRDDARELAGPQEDA